MDDAAKKTQNLPGTSGVIVVKNNQRRPESWAAAICAGILNLVLSFIAVCVVPQMLPHQVGNIFGIFGLVGYFIISPLVVAGAFAPRRVLENRKIAVLIGSSNHKVARLMCIIAVIIFWVIIPCFYVWLES